MIPANHPFVKAISLALRSRCATQPGDRLLLAVSGGADSTAMLLAIHALAPTKPWQLDLHIAHINHHLRPCADEDARFVQQLADQLNLPRTVIDIHPPDNEAAARDARYRALAEHSATINADATVTAHHADDQLETLLMRLIRGTALPGLTGIQSRRTLYDQTVIRPLLRTTHAACLDLCAQANITPAVDPTNTDTTKTRNRIRRDILPILNDLRPDASVKADDAAQALTDANTLIEQLTADLLTQHVRFNGSSASLPRATARSLSPAALRLIITQTARTLGLPADALPARTVEQIALAAADASNENRRFDLAANLTAHVSPAELTLQPAP